MRATLRNPKSVLEFRPRFATLFRFLLLCGVLPALPLALWFAARDGAFDGLLDDAAGKQRAVMQIYLAVIGGSLVAALVGLAGVLAYLCVLFYRFFTTPTGIYGRDVVGRLRTIGWERIATVAPRSVLGMRFVRIDDGTGWPLWLPRFVTTRPALLGELEKRLGAAHPLVTEMRDPS
jgi:hypothetical protein